MNFKRFSTSDNQWYDVPYYQHKTATDTLSLPATLYPNASSITVALKGQSSQSGTPSPSNPVDVVGCGERTSNLCDESTLQNGYYSGAIAYFANDNYRCFVLTLDAGTYTIKATITNNAAYLLRISSTTLGVNQINTYTQYTFTLEERDTAYISLRNRDTTTDFTGLTIMLNSGSTSLPYEPYGYKIPISSASTTTPVYLGEVETTRRIRKLVLTGEEIWVKSGAYQGSFYSQVISGVLSEDYTAYCSHLTFTTLSKYAKGKFCFNGGVTKNCNLWFNQFDSNTNVEELKSYLAAQYAAGTPVTVWYVLATEETGIVNEPLHKIGDYADEVSGITIPVTAGTNTISVDTTLQPSEATTTYKGWHPVSAVHERESGQWD